MDLELLKQYEIIYKKVQEKNKSNSKKNGELTICPAIAGENYYVSNDTKIMFVGRAINGWCPLIGVSKDSIAERIKLCERCTLDWINKYEDKDPWEVCRVNGCEYARNQVVADGREKRYSPFWQLVIYISKKYGLGSDWYKKIVWSNLYKASYVEGGNPKDFYEDQIDECNSILIREVEIFKPDVIVFITEPNYKNKTKQTRTWFCKEYTNPKLVFADVYKFLSNNKEIKVFILERPEFNNKDIIWKNKEDLDGNIILGE